MQASEHFLQHSKSCLPHSAAQALQHFIHKAQSSSANWESLAHSEAQSPHISAQSMQSFAQL